MRVLSAIPGEFAAPVDAPPPVLTTDGEQVFPAIKVIVRYGEPLDLPDAQGRRLLHRFGIAGVIEIPSDTSEQDIDRYMTEAKEVRYEHLRQQCDDFRMIQAANQARGVEVRLPDRNLRAIFAETKTLHEELAGRTDEILKTVFPKHQSAPNPLATEAESYGLPAGVANVVPKLSDEAALEGLDL